MTKRDVVSLAVKIIGVFYLVQAVPFVVASLFAGGSAGSSSGVILVLGILVLGALLVWGSEAVGDLLVPKKENAAVPAVLSLSDWQTVAFSAIGVSTFIRGVQQLGAVMSYPTQNFRYQSIVSGIIMAAIGAGLFFGARGLANLWKSFQERRSNL